MGSVKLETSCLRNKRGEYIKFLTIDGVSWMTNDDHEIDDNARALITASGDCYIGGLGMGMIAEECAALDRVDSVTVVEINPEVISLIQPKISSPKINIVLGDATCDFCDRKYDWMYFDMWLEPNAAARDMMLESFSNARPYLKENGVLEAWTRPRLEAGDLLDI